MYEEEDWTIDLPRTSSEWANDAESDLAGILEHELSDRLADLAEGGCENGGWPDDEQVSVSNVALDAEYLRAEITIDFTEVIASGCPDMPHRERRDRRLTLSLPRGGTVGYLDLSDSDPQGWSLEDRNSAADGT